MPSEIDMRRTKILKVTSYLLLAAGILMAIPYPIFYAIKIVLEASGRNMFAPGHAFMIFLVLGQLLLCAPLFSIALSALGVESPEEKFHVLIDGYVRYLPALILGACALICTGKTENAYIPGMFGIALIIYAAILLKRDARASVKPG